MNLKRAHLTPLTNAQKDEILSYWSQYRNVKSELDWFAFYNTLCEDKNRLKYYIPESVYYTDIDTHFTLVRRCEELDDKNLYDLLLPDMRKPLTVVRKTNGVILDRDYRIITARQALELCKQHQHVISKETRISAGGNGITFMDFPGCGDEEFLDWIGKAQDVNIQEIIQQHECLNRLHANSINSLRIMSLLLDDQVHIVSSVLRMGRDGSRVDNASSGGVACGIKPDGTLREFAFDKRGNKLSQHPQGAVFKDTKIVGYDKCCELIRSHAGILCNASRLVSWDFTIGPDGEPILIEVNLTFGGVTIHQMCNGPIMGEMTDDILSRVYHSNK